MSEGLAFDHPPLKGEGKGRRFAAEGGPGWDGSGTADERGAGYAGPLSPPPGPLTRADLPPPGGGEPVIIQAQ
jgi:hypothetical protein